MSNFGLQDPSPPFLMEDQAKHETLTHMQMEALGLRRREDLLTADFKENKYSYVPTARLESQRLVNKSSIGEGEKSKLQGWNNAWTHLQDDGSDSQNQQDVNEGMGQTHRAKLMNDASVRDYTGEENFRGGGRGGRGGRGDHGGRGGGYAGRVTGRGGGGRANGERRVTFLQPTTRVRVPRGHNSTAQPDVSRGQPVPILKSISTVNPAKEKNRLPSAPVTSARRPMSRYDGMLAAPNAFMASIRIRKEETRDEPSIKFASSLANASNEEATGPNTDTSISTITTNTSISNEKAMTHKLNTPAMDRPSFKKTTAADEPKVSVESRLKADLMDLDIGQETTQPVLQFTASGVKKQPPLRAVKTSSSFDEHIEALEKSGVLNATQLEVLKSIQTQVHIRENPTTPVKEAARQGIYTTSELVSLRPATAAPKVTTGIARKFAEQQKAFLIGEHVHKTRYHTAASLTQDFEKLSISDKKPAKPAVTKLSTIEKSRTNPFGPPPANGKGPSLPAHLLNQTTTADHGSAAGSQYLGANDSLAPISNRQSLGDTTATTRPSRGNMINQTGFIALAENRANVAAGKKGEDPLLVARKRGL